MTTWLLFRIVVTREGSWIVLGTRLRRLRRWLWVGVAVLLPLSVAAAWLGSLGGTGVSFPPSPLIGLRAPPIVGVDVMSERIYSVPSGRWVVLTFFATWCGPCRKEQPELVRFVAAHAKRRDVEVLSVIYRDASQAVRAFERTHGGTWPVLTDPRGVIASSYAVLAVPWSFVIDPEGIVSASILGGVTQAQLESSKPKE